MSDKVHTTKGNNLSGDSLPMVLYILWCCLIYLRIQVSPEKEIHWRNVALCGMPKTGGGGGAGRLPIYTGGGVPLYIKQGGLRHGYNPQKKGLRHGHNPKQGGLRHGHESKRGLLGTGTTRQKGGRKNWSCEKRRS